MQYGLIIVTVQHLENNSNTLDILEILSEADGSLEISSAIV
jgi:hypothetical protein